ncbi:MAG: amidase [Rhodobacteraceae bacterium]|nr:amidase [Paracoccaceae bacterium]
MDLWRLNIHELTAGYRNGKFSPVEIFDSTVKRIDAVNPVLNAIVSFNWAEARAAAEASAARWKNDAALSEIDGVPITVKDNIPVRGLPCTWGSRSYADYRPERDEFPIARLRQAGVVILGKTNAPEFTLQGYTDNLVYGATGNPWNPDLTPGGSSGGAVAAVASGMGVAAIATDGGGSIRRPCAHTGLYGLKPSPGFVGRADGLPALLGDFETMGPIARSASDLRCILQIMAARHPFDRASMAFTEEQRRQAPRVAPGRKILCVAQFGDAPVDPDIRSSLLNACDTLTALGHHVESGSVPFDVDRLNAIWGLIGPVGLAWLVDSHGIDPSLLNDSLLPMIEVGRSASASQYVQLLNDVADFRVGLARIFTAYDFILTPSVAAMPWPKAESHPELINGTAAGPRGHAIFTPFANAGGLPGINLPTRPSANNMPIGCQIVGPFGSDLELVSMAEAYENEMGRFRWPNL